MQSYTMPLPELRPRERGFLLAIVPLAIFGAIVAGCGSASTAVAPSSTNKCDVSVAASTTSVDASGGRGRLTVETERECSWTATSGVAWIKLEGPTQGQGPGSVEFTVAANADPSPRTGVLTVADDQVSITQRAGTCEYELAFDSAPVPAAGGTRNIDVRTSSQACTWSAASRVDWIRIRGGSSGTGNGRVTIEVAATTGPPRIGTVVIADRTIDVTQADGCSYTVAPPALSVPAARGTSSVTVTASGPCPWTATSSVPWIVIGGSSFTGSGSARLDIEANQGPERSGVVTVAGHQVQVRQASGCTFQVNPRSLSVPAAGGSLSVSVVTAAACPWSASSSVPWITVSEDSGGGSARLTVAANEGPARTGTVTVAGHSVSVQQASGCTFSVSPTSLLFGANGNAHTLTIAAGAGCAWTASTDEPSWLILSAAGGVGPGTLGVRARANSGGERSGTVLVAGQRVTAVQMWLCTYNLSPSSATYGPLGGTASFRVTTDADCAWRARPVPGVNWVGVLSGGDGRGNGTVVYVVAPNLGPDRTTQIMVEDQPFTIRQSGS